MDSTVRRNDDPAGPALGAWRDLGGGVHAARAEPDAVTIGLVVGADGALVIDTGSTPAQGRTIRAAAEERAGVPVVGVVVTHAHTDHWRGLAGFDSVTSYGHETLVQRLAAVSGTDASAADLRAPTRAFALAASVDLGGIRVEMAHVGRGHTEGDVVVTVTRPPVGRSRVGAPSHVFVGDLLESAGPPWFGADAYPMEWPATLDGVFELVDEATVLVPGHGEAVTRNDMIGQRAEIAAVAGELHRLVEAGIAPQHAAEQGQWPFPFEHLAEVIVPAYDQLHASGVRATRPTLPLIDPHH